MMTLFKKKGLLKKDKIRFVGEPGYHNCGGLLWFFFSFGLLCQFLLHLLLRYFSHTLFG
eukprot:m.51069 g.51069  ORF g.51069 m.51069 type:complete len:59 (+) comp12592_c0_seq2:1621-1797(+)